VRGRKVRLVRPEVVCVGVRVRVREHHRIAERRGMVGEVVGLYGGEEYVAVDVRFSDGEYRLFWPGDLDEISSSQPSWWRALLGWSGAT
jgi:hypothetical protein